MCVKLTNVKPHSILLWKMLLYCLILMLQHTKLPFQSNLCLNHCQIFSKVILSNYYQVCKSKMKIGTRSGFDFSLIGEKKRLKCNITYSQDVMLVISIFHIQSMTSLCCSQCFLWDQAGCVHLCCQRIRLNPHFKLQNKRRKTVWVRT